VAAARRCELEKIVHSRPGREGCNGGGVDIGGGGGHLLSSSPNSSAPEGSGGGSPTCLGDAGSLRFSSPSSLHMENNVSCCFTENNDVDCYARKETELRRG
jgi:hypothetical protein